MTTAKNVLITGATSGLGESLFHHYAGLGHKVIACGRNNDKLSQLSNDAMLTLTFNVLEPEAIKLAAEQVSELDVLILNAGDCRYIDDAKHFDGQLFSDIVATNLTSLGWLLQYFLPKVTPGGQVVFVSSSATILPFSRAQAYGASKAGVDYLANSLRLDLKKENIDVTLVHPGFVKTRLTDKNDFNMPFIISSELAARLIYEGVANRKNYLHFPKRLTLLLKAIACLPTWCWASLSMRNKQS